MEDAAGAPTAGTSWRRPAPEPPGRRPRRDRRGRLGGPPLTPARPPPRWRWRPPTATSPCPAGRTTRSTSSGSSRSTRAPRVAQLSTHVQGPRPAHGADPRLPAERRHQDHADQPRAGPAARPDRLAHRPLARLRHPVAAQRRRARGLGGGADRQAAHLLLPPAPRGHVHVPLPLRGRRARADGHDRHRVRPAAAGRHARSAGSRRFAYNDGDGSTGYHRHFAILLERGLGRTSTTATATSRSRSRPTTTRSGSPSTAAATRRPCCRTTTRRCRDLRITRRTRTTTTRRPQPAELGADPGQPGRAGAAAAREPRLPAARDGAAGDPDARRRPGRVAAARRQRRHVVLTNTLYIGPGEARDVLFDAPAYNAARPSGSDGRGTTTSTTSRTATGASCRTTAPPDPAG